MTDETTKQKIYEHATVAFKKLSVSDGDIVVVSFPEDIAMEQMEAFAEYMEDAIVNDITVFCTRDDIQIESLSKNKLNALGWYNINDSAEDTPTLN